MNEGVPDPLLCFDLLWFSCVLQFCTDFIAEKVTSLKNIRFLNSTLEFLNVTQDSISDISAISAHNVTDADVSEFGDENSIDSTGSEDILYKSEEQNFDHTDSDSSADNNENLLPSKVVDKKFHVSATESNISDGNNGILQPSKVVAKTCHIIDSENNTSADSNGILQPSKVVAKTSHIVDSENNISADYNEIFTPFQIS